MSQVKMDIVITEDDRYTMKEYLDHIMNRQENADIDAMLAQIVRMLKEQSLMTRRTILPAWARTVIEIEGWRQANIAQESRIAKLRMELETLLQERRDDTLARDDQKT